MGESAKTRSLVAFVLLCVAAKVRADGAIPARPVTLARIVDESQVELSDGAARTSVRRGERFGPWTLVEIVAGARTFAVLEDFERMDGHLLFVDAAGRIDLAKTLEPTGPEPPLFLGHSAREVASSAVDILGRQILSGPGDPDYAEIARVFPPIQNVQWGTHNFVGTPDTSDKVGFSYGGRSANFDPAVYQPSIEAIRKSGQVSHGLVGGYLPIIRYVYPELDGNWTEMLAFAPWRRVNDNPRIQPVWYRVSRIEHQRLKWTIHVDSYYPVPPRQSDDPRSFYADLLKLKQRWDTILAPGMKVALPDERLANLTRLSLIRAIMTRVGDFPKYGVLDKDYAGNEHDGFPDTFTVETTAMLEWGLIERAGGYIDNYFGSFVQDDGNILYRGPEIGQFGRMLSVVAQYVNRGGRVDLLLKRRSRIDAITKLLLTLRAQALQRPPDDPARGMLAGWTEADSCLEPEPERYRQPYFSNSTEAARGLRELGLVWTQIGRRSTNGALAAWGERLQREAAELQADIETSVSRSMIERDGMRMLPAIAGAKEPFDVAVRLDPHDPQCRAYRAYNEMMYSGILPAAQIRSIVDYRSTHHDVILGFPTAYNQPELAGFLAYGYGYGLIQTDMVREALLMLYSDIAHQYTRGAWMAPETRRPLTSEQPTAPYCTPAQLVAPLMTRWLLVFEEPDSNTLWLGKAIPRRWLEDGSVLSVSDAPTRWGRVSFSIESRARTGTITAQLQLPKAGVRAQIKLRLRAPGGVRMSSVTLNGKVWPRFDPADEVVSLPPEISGTTRLVAHYQH